MKEFVTHKTKVYYLDANDNLRRFHFLLHKKFNLIGSGGHIALFQKQLLHEKRGLKVQNFLIFPIGKGFQKKIDYGKFHIGY